MESCFKILHITNPPWFWQDRSRSRPVSVVTAMQTASGCTVGIAHTGNKRCFYCRSKGYSVAGNLTGDATQVWLIIDAGLEQTGSRDKSWALYCWKTMPFPLTVTVLICTVSTWNQTSLWCNVCVNDIILKKKMFLPRLETALCPSIFLMFCSMGKVGTCSLLSQTAYLY